MTPRRTCALCDSPNLTPLFDFPDYPFMQIELIKPVVSIDKRLLSIVGCLHCGFVQQRSLFDENDLKHLYSHIYDETLYPRRSNEIGGHDPLLEVVRRYLPNGGSRPRVLEIGCGNGKRIRHLEKQSRIESFGVDPGLPEKLQGTNFAHSVFRAGLFAKPFHVIFHNNLFEHIPRPLQFLRETREELETSGIHIINIPNEEKFLDRCHIGRFIHEHILYFTPAHMEIMLRKAGYRVIELIVTDTQITAVAKKDGSPKNTADPGSPLTPTPQFFARYRELFSNLHDGFTEIKSFCKNKTIALYGGSHLCYMVLASGIFDPSQLFFIMDRQKKGLYLAGIDVDITDDIHRLNTVDLVIVVAQNAQEEILAGIKSSLNRPPQLITLFPKPITHHGGSL